MNLKTAESQASSQPIQLQPMSRRRFLTTGLCGGAVLAFYSGEIERHWIEVIRTGEITGKMSAVLLDLNRQIRESRETRRKVTGALMYPMMLIVFAITAVTVMLWLVVPTFAKMFKDMGAELPGITQFVVDSSGFLVKYGVYVLVGVIIVVVAFRKYMKTERGRRRVGGFGTAGLDNNYNTT